MLIAIYLTKEVLKSLLMIFLLLLFVSLTNQFIGHLSLAAKGQLPVKLVSEIVILYIPELLTSLAPLAMFLAILFAHGRIHADSEMSVLFTCGYSWRQLTLNTMFLAIIVATIVTICSLWLVPKTINVREEKLAEGEAVGILSAIVPGKFQIMNNGRLVFYVEDYDNNADNNSPTAPLRQMFIAQAPEKPNDDWSILTANQAKIISNDNTKFFLELINGHRYTGSPTNNNFTKIDFTTYGREIINTAPKVNNHLRLQSLAQLISSKQPDAIAELQWRIAMPISTLVLTIIAISLAKVNPRQGRYAKFLPAIIIFIIYLNSLTVCKRWIESGKLNYGAWMFAIHGLFLLYGLYMLIINSNNKKNS